MARARKNRRLVDQKATRAATFSVVRRALRAIGSIGLVVGICAATAYGAARVKEYFYTSPTFAIEKFQFETILQVREQELIRLGGLAIGDNIFQFDLYEAEKGMGDHPWVQRVSLERKYPRTVMVKVKEHEPVALVDLGGLYYVNKEGKAFKKLTPGEPGDLPILRGVTREEYVAGNEETEAFFRESLEVYELYKQAGLEKVESVSEIKIDRHEGFTFFCGVDAIAVKIGFGEYPGKFSKLDQILTKLSSRKERAEIVYLDNRTRPTWVPVQLAHQQEEEEKEK